MFLQIIRAKPGQGGGGHVGLDSDGHGNGPAPDVTQGLVEGEAVLEVEAEAAVLYRLVNTKQTSGPELGEDLLGRILSRGLPLINERVDVVVNDGLGRLLHGQLVLLVVSDGRHPRQLWRGSAGGEISGDAPWQTLPGEESVERERRPHGHVQSSGDKMKTVQSTLTEYFYFVTSHSTLSADNKLFSLPFTASCQSALRFTQPLTQTSSRIILRCSSVRHTHILPQSAIAEILTGYEYCVWSLGKL